MRLAVKLFSCLFIVSTVCGLCFAQENHSYILHTIEKGQNLYSIAKMYNVSTQDIIGMNPGSNEVIYAGKTLKIPTTTQESKSETYHTIQSGETLYKLTTIYNISAKAICQANPGLSAENFRAGEVIRIPLEEKDKENEHAPSIPQEVKPRCKQMHKVKRKETIYSVSRAYGITEKELIEANPELQEGMKKGQLICIPYHNESSDTKTRQPVIAQDNNSLFELHKERPQQIPTIKAALILPFKEDKRMVEYYEGFLIAVDSLKRIGISMDLYVFDSGKEEKDLNAILAKKELGNMNIIIGPMYQQHIKPLAEFAQKHSIRLVIPFSQQNEEVFDTPVIYQINTPQSYLYSEVYEHFTRKFTNGRVIFIESSNDEDDKVDFIAGLKQELSLKGFVMLSLKDNATQEELLAAMSLDKDNIFILSSGKNAVLTKTLPQLTLLTRNNPDYSIHMFGYPEWQTYTKDYLDSFFELDVYFYSSFYTNTIFPTAVHFTNLYHKWYSKDLTSKYPNYAMLGYDSGFFFLYGLAKYGTALEEHLTQINTTPIQTGFKFERVNNWGGFINKKVFFINFTKNFELVKLDFE